MNRLVAEMKGLSSRQKKICIFPMNLTGSDDQSPSEFNASKNYGSGGIKGT